MMAGVATVPPDFEMVTRAAIVAVDNDRGSLEADSRGVLERRRDSDSLLGEARPELASCGAWESASSADVIRSSSDSSDMPRSSATSSLIP